MRRQTRELLVTLKRLNEALPQVILSVAHGTVDADRQAEFGGLLVEAGELLRAHAAGDVPVIVESNGTTEPDQS